MGVATQQPRIPFASVNLAHDVVYQEGLVRHHLAPSQSFRDPELRPFLLKLQIDGLHMDDFATNGILLPAIPSISKSTGLPIHVGGHPNYNLRIINELRAIRVSCESIRGDSQRRRSAVSGIRALQDRARKAIINQHSGHVDRVVLSHPSDDSLDALIDRLHLRMAQKTIVIRA
jgi:A nuclease family of the HNH/ENDO VII superfamily with conserved AHH